MAVETKKHAPLASWGQDAFDLLADAMVPAKPADKSYEELVQPIKQQLTIWLRTYASYAPLQMNAPLANN